MAKKKDEYYYETLVKLVEYSCKEADLLNQIVTDFKSGRFLSKMKEMHYIGHDADEARYTMIKELIKEFITPIEREDILELANSIDSLTDAIEDVAIHMYMYNITRIRPYATNLAIVVVKCCNSLKIAMSEFYNFRKSKTLLKLVSEVNKIKKDADKLYSEAMRDLYIKCYEFKEVSAWEATFLLLVKCCNACTDVSKVIESVVIKNL